MPDDTNPTPSDTSGTGTPTPPKPSVTSDTYGDITLAISTGSQADCYPHKDGLDPSGYTHVQAVLHHGDGNPVTPASLGLDWFAPFFAANGVGSFVSVDIVAQLRAALQERERQITPAESS